MTSHLPAIWLRTSPPKHRVPDPIIGSSSYQYKSLSCAPVRFACSSYQNSENQKSDSPPLARLELLLQIFGTWALDVQLLQPACHVPSDLPGNRSSLLTGALGNTQLCSQRCKHVRANQGAANIKGMRPTRQWRELSIAQSPANTTVN